VCIYILNLISLSITKYNFDKKSYKIYNENTKRPNKSTIHINNSSPNKSLKIFFLLIESTINLPLMDKKKKKKNTTRMVLHSFIGDATMWRILDVVEFIKFMSTKVSSAASSYRDFIHIYLFIIKCFFKINSWKVNYFLYLLMSYNMRW
jgi:hypothetical protein